MGFFLPRQKCADTFLQPVAYGVLIVPVEMGVYPIGIGEVFPFEGQKLTEVAACDVFGKDNPLPAVVAGGIYD